MGAKNINLLIALAFISQKCMFSLDFSILFESNCVYLGFNLIAVFCCPLDATNATMVVKEAKILQNFPEIPSQVMKDLILVLIALVSKYLTF